MLRRGSIVALVLFLGAGLWSCRQPKPFIQASVTVLPATVTLSCEGTRRFIPQLSEGCTYPVTWSVTEPNGGTIGADGTYVAPAVPGLFTIVAKEAGWQHAQGKANIRVVAKPDGTIRVPDFIRVGAKGLKAEVPVQEGSTYQWSISGGTLLSSAEGPFVVFDAGTSKHILLKCHVTNAAGDALNSSLDVETYPEPQVVVRPDHAVLSTGEDRQFGFDLSGRLDTPLLWKVEEEGGGTIDPKGNYKAPETPGSFHVQAFFSQGKPAGQATVKVVTRPQGRIELSEHLVAGADHVKACVPVQVGMTYRWKVMGGSVVVGEHDSCLQFTVGSGPTLVLTCVMTNEAGASLELTRTLQVRPRAK